MSRTMFLILLTFAMLACSVEPRPDEPVAFGESFAGESEYGPDAFYNDLISMYCRHDEVCALAYDSRDACEDAIVDPNGALAADWGNPDECDPSQNDPYDALACIRAATAEISWYFPVCEYYPGLMGPLVIDYLPECADLCLSGVVRW